ICNYEVGHAIKCTCQAGTGSAHSLLGLQCPGFASMSKRSANDWWPHIIRREPWHSVGRFRTMARPASEECPLGISWHDTAWIQALEPGNVMDYFSERSNPFYDRTCNNEIVKMQRLSADQLSQMTGLEYILLHAQEPILYVVRKQHRHSPSQVTPLADYYVLAGVVYQAPDLGAVLNSRLLATAHRLQAALDESLSFARYHPFRGYWWQFPDGRPQPKPPAKHAPGSIFQRRRVDLLLAELAANFPPKQHEEAAKQETPAPRPEPSQAKSARGEKRPRLA
ncbi:unnamed protein product, partial [Ixodes pacificus]